MQNLLNRPDDPQKTTLLLIPVFFPRMLEMNIDKVLAGRAGVRFFFPLCGKAVDMKWYVNVCRCSPCTPPVIAALYFQFLLVWLPG